jgi:predicted nucleic-acid-binding Zn-ribbon protein
MEDACPKCENGSRTSLQVSVFAPYRSRGSGVEQKWPLNLLICEGCGYAESYVEKGDIERLRSLSEKQKRLSESKVQALK